MSSLSSHERPSLTAPNTDKNEKGKERKKGMFNHALTWISFKSAVTLVSEKD
jgi:hypothetical protein